MAKLGRFQRTILDDEGDVVEGATVEVRSEFTGNLASLFSDRTGLAGITNPQVTDAEGFVSFFAAGGSYKVRAYLGPSGSPTFERIWRYVGIGTAAEYDASDLLFAFGIFFSASGKPDAGEILPFWQAPVAMTLKDTTGWYAGVRVAPTVAKTFSVVKNGVEFASILFAIGATSGVITFPAETEIAAGDKIWVICPAFSDATLSSFSLTMLARR